MFEHPLFVLAVLGLIIAMTEWLVRHTFMRHLGTALLVIVITAAASNTGLLPSFARGGTVYSGIFEYVAPFAIFWLLLGVRLKEVLRAGKWMLLLFGVGAAGTAIGVLMAVATSAPDAFGADRAALGGMFAGTYSGGSINFNAVALHYGVSEKGTLFAAATAVDSILTTIWMAATIVLPAWLHRMAPKRFPRGARASAGPEAGGGGGDAETVHPAHLGAQLALAAGCVWFSEIAVRWIEQRSGVAVPSILVLTTVALVLAQLPAVERLRGARVLGLFAVYLFLAAIGALCDLGALAGAGDLGLALLRLVTVAVLVHGFVVFLVSALFRADVDVAAVASQAAVGGGTSALALARSLGRFDLVVPGILAGALGSALGTYLGFAVAGVLS